MEVFNLPYIKQRRLILNMTLSQVADPLGIKNASTYMKYENGTYSFKAEHLPLLAEALECKVANFFATKVAEIAIKGR